MHYSPTHGTMRMKQRTLTAKTHQEYNLSKATSSPFFLNETIAKLERTQRTAQQNRSETQLPQTIGAAINNN